jgi:hypothetical protein
MESPRIFGPEFSVELLQGQNKDASTRAERGSEKDDE